LDSSGKAVVEQSSEVKLQPYLRTDIPVSIQLPEVSGGYVLVAEFTPEGGAPVMSRRFLRVGQSEKYSFYNLSSK
jgi:hypothetical protein